MLKGRKIFFRKATNFVINDWGVTSKYSSQYEGFKVFFLGQTVFKRSFNRRNSEYPAVKELPLPSNIEDLASSEKLKFSPQRSRDINGNYIKFSISPITKFTEAKPKLQEDERVQCYDCSGTVNLSSAMQTNVPFPFKSAGKPMHLNMPGGQWAQNEKYTSEDLNSLHQLNFKNSTTNGGTSLLSFKSGVRNSFLYFPAMHFRTCGCLCLNGFNVFNYQSHNFYSQKEKIENFDSHDQKTEAKNISQLTGKDKLKAAIKDYGSVILVFHVGISLLSLGCCYGLIASGVDMSTIFKDWGVQDGASAAGAAAQFVVAYAVHKSLAPARIAVTLSAAPFIVKKLRKIGLLKTAQVKEK